jgi:transposase-like protein
VSLTGPDGLLKQLTKTVLETALNQEMTEHLGHDKHSPAGNEAGNVRNGTRAKTVLTESTGEVGIAVPRDRTGTFEPQIVKKRQRRLTGVDEIVLSLYAKGLRRIQPVCARSSASFSDGFMKPSVLRGRLLRLAAIRARSSAECTDRSVPLAGTGAAARWCSRSTRAARGRGGRRSRPGCRWRW